MISTSAAASSPIEAASRRIRSMRPVAVAPVRARHVVGERGRPIRAKASQMGRHQLTAVEDLHRLRRDAGFDFFAEQPERHRVRMLLTSTFSTCRPTNVPDKAFHAPLLAGLTAVKPRSPRSGARRRRADLMAVGPGENNAMAERCWALFSYLGRIFVALAGYGSGSGRPPATDHPFVGAFGILQAFALCCSGFRAIVA